MEVVGGGVVMSNKNEEDDNNQVMILPPGFRFHPTDEEIIIYYLREKVMNNKFSAKAIGEADLNRCEPWDLPKKAKMGEKEWWFFCQRDRKYPTGMRTNRATESGYWKATGKDKEIYKGNKNNSSGELVGMKKTLVFYKGRAPKGEKTNWIMHEFRLEGQVSYYNFPKGAKDEWVVCRVSHKNPGTAMMRRGPELARIDSFVNQLLDSPNSLPALLETTPESSSFENGSYGTIQHQQENFSTSFSTQKQQWPPMMMTEQMQKKPMFAAPSFNLLHHGSSSNSSAGKGKVVDDDDEDLHPLHHRHRHDHHHQECKLEQFSSNNSMVSISQDTGLSNDNVVGAAEISSGVIDNIISRPENSFDIADLDSFWDY